MKFLPRLLVYLLGFAFLGFFSISAQAKSQQNSSDSLDTLDSEGTTTSTSTSTMVTPPMKSSAPMKTARRSTMSLDDADIDHYENKDRRVTVNLGMFVPEGDFQGAFNVAPLIGLHFVWEEIYPFAFTVGFERASADHTGNSQLGKLVVNEITVGTKASFPVGRVIPFIKIEGAFCFNDVSFGGAIGSTPPFIVSGNDSFLTSMGINGGLGLDFVVGRDFGLGVEATYHYPIPKTVSLSDGTNFNLASPWADVSLRLSF
jgi:hypothetical protein